MQDLHPIDKAHIEPVLGGHEAALDAIESSMKGLYGLGGVATVTVAAAAPWVVLQKVSLAPLQIALLVAAAALMTLVIVRSAAQRRAQHHRQRFEQYCQEHGLSLEEVIAKARCVPNRWGFFVGLWDERPPA